MRAALVFLLLLPGAASAEKIPCRPGFRNPCTPSRQVKEKILELAREGVQAQKKWRTARYTEGLLRDALREEEKFRRAGKGRMSAQEYEQNLLAWQKAYTDMHDLEISARRTLEAALQLTMSAYQIERIPTASITGGPSRGVRPESEMESQSLHGITFFNGRAVLTVARSRRVLPSAC
ncbi:MAG: hypothetical protein AUJ52_15295 [Elusimicrobia bacterium CG1_02_63_36]|nr:MAG: hypothetical protein AUJ52_15295 [Elusimicrobia bacterium CG1_02_63_36]PJA14634.1 MAG: hypothetical protein COX66_12060 [Elusimicrobia bacterium CG_4_10_14_0_2_um_filter_63_34]PJB26145.1 MAG: hypothetical protein CO113_04840 [Elusimicrobia bacterium CG_4_9_14_3_um_filter_62_55]